MSFHTGQRVAYRAIPEAPPEHGVITEAYATPIASRVRYGDEILSKLTEHRDLDPDESAEEIVLVAARAALCAAAELTALLNDLTEETRLAPNGGVWGAVIDHRAHIASTTLALEAAIRETMPLVTWAEDGQAIVPGRLGAAYAPRKRAGGTP